MFYEKPLKITADTAKASPESASLKVVRGIVHLVEIRFKSGCASNVGVRVLQQGVQRWPSNKEEWISDTNRAVTFNEALPVRSGHTHFKIEGYNLDTANAHTVRVRIGILKEAELFPLWQMWISIQRFLRIFKKR